MLETRVEEFSKAEHIILTRPPRNKTLLRGVDNRLGSGGDDGGHDFRDQAVVRVIDNDGSGGQDLVGVVLRD